MEELFNEYREFIKLLEEMQEVSLLSHYSEVMRKSLLLSVASRFEKQVCESLISLFDENHQCLISFISNKAIHRQYHTYFKWDSANANQFFGLFGEDFKKYMGNKIKNDPNLKTSIQEFLSLGLDRNRLVHDDYASFTFEKTVDEIFQSYERAKEFVENIKLFVYEFRTIELVDGDSADKEALTVDAVRYPEIFAEAKGQVRNPCSESGGEISETEDHNLI